MTTSDRSAFGAGGFSAAAGFLAAFGVASLSEFRKPDCESTNRCISTPVRSVMLSTPVTWSGRGFLAGGGLALDRAACGSLLRKISSPVALIVLGCGLLDRSV